ncbi:helix-turn-helix transcriptional regulator [Streptomyces brasiliscabiei]|uniref:Helix-turn-helix transcriptional regulator n=1 Tax=Streptomyces brasiliscabiei TaxID=2736302 RepID=A0ABU8G9U8_9ACTN
MNADRLRNLYGQADGRWLLAEFVFPYGRGFQAPAHIGDLTLLGEPRDVLADLYGRIRLGQQRDTERARAARAAYCAALDAWDAADPAIRGPVPELPPGWQPAKRGPRAGVQQQLAELLGVGQQAVSRYLNRKSEMTLTDDGWSALTRAWFDMEPNR